MAVKKKSRTNTDAKKAKFLAAFVETATIRGAVRASGVDDETHYNWLRKDPEYVKRFEEAERKSIKAMEAEGRRRAIEGVRRLKFDKSGAPIIDPETGQPYVEHAYSDTLLIFLLKGAAPEKYRERFEHSGPDGGAMRINIEGLDELIRLGHEDEQFTEFRRQQLLGHHPQPGVNGHGHESGPLANGKAPGVNGSSGR